MLFNSFDFAIFLPVVFILYWFVCNKNLKLQNILIVAASYLFYGWWDWRFLSLILFSTVVDFIIGRQLSTKENKGDRKKLLYLSLVVNLGILGFFKYYNFFLDNFVEAFTFMGFEISPRSLNILLPVGISFYTFQTLSYTIDVYREKLEPAKDFFEFAAFVSFFPQLVAGPIERASNLLPQFTKSRSFDYDLAINGIMQILWGFVKKLVIADNCAFYANMIFNSSDTFSGSELFLGAVFFTFQIYGDFSGYSDIAIGTSRLFGFDLKQNFAMPYFSRDIAEFWRRWHISLSTWFRDYLYIPLGGSRGGTGMKVRNTFIIFLVSGFWHGANWTFLVWGGLNALYFLPLLLAKKNRSNIEVVAKGKYLPSVKELFQMSFTFLLAVLAWVFFRAENVGHALDILSNIFSSSFLNIPSFEGIDDAANIGILIVVFMIFEWIGREYKFGLEWAATINRYSRYAVIAAVILFIVLFQSPVEQEFIYFQF